MTLTCSVVGVQLVSGMKPFSAVNSTVELVRLQAMPTSRSVSGFGMMCQPLPCQNLPSQSNGSGALQAFRIRSTDSRNISRGSPGIFPRWVFCATLMPTPKPGR